MTDGNGTGGGQRVSIDIIDNGEGWALLSAGTERPPLEALPGLLSNSLVDWMRQHPDRTVYNTLGVVSHGATTSIHVWYEDSAA